MKALAILSVIVAGISVIIPIGGVAGAILACWMASFCFRNESTLALIAGGLSIINFVLLSPLNYSFLIGAGVDHVFTSILIISALFQMLPMYIGYCYTKESY